MIFEDEILGGFFFLYSRRSHRFRFVGGFFFIFFFLNLLLGLFNCNSIYILLL